MTREETKKIIMIIASTYPNFKPNNMSMIVDSWHFFLADYNYNDMAIALKTYVNTSGTGFAPSVDQLIALTRKVETLTQLTEGEAWTLVSRAVRNGLYHAEEEFNKLPETCQKIVGSPNQLTSWAMGDAEALETVVASNFQRSYRVMIQRERDIKALPMEARQKLENIQRMAIGTNDSM